jgi:outer membrane protein TolC
MILWLLVVGAHAMSLDEARGLAEAQALEVAAAEARADEAGALAWAAMGYALPSVTGFADYSIGSGQTAFGFERPILDQLGVGVRGSWRLIDPSGWVAAAGARRSARGQQAMLDWARLTARSQATAAYAEVLAAQEVVAAWERSLEDAERQESASASLVEAGLRPPADRAQAVAAREGARASLIASQGELTVRCAELQGLLNQEVTGTCALEPVEWGEPASATAEHPALVAAREARAAARAGKASASLGLAPSVSFTGTAANYWVSDTSGFGWNAGVGVSMPLFEGSTNLADIAASSARARQADTASSTQERDLSVLRISSEARLRAAQAGVEALQEALASAEEGLRLVDERYRAGLDGIAEWLAARRQRDLAAISLAEGHGSLGRAVAEVEAAHGVW